MWCMLYSGNGEALNKAYGNGEALTAVTTRRFIRSLQAVNKAYVQAVNKPYVCAIKSVYAVYKSVWCIPVTPRPFIRSFPRSPMMIE